MSNSLWPNGLQHARLSCPSPTPGVYSNPCPLSQWCHPAISSSVVPFSFCPESLPASGSFPMSQLFAGGGQSTGVSASASVLPVNTHDWSSLGWTSWISLQSKGLSSSFSNTTVQKHQFFDSAFFTVQLSHPYMTGKTIALTRQNFVGKVMSLLFSMLSRLVITFLPRGKHLLISWLQSPSAVILEPKKIKSATMSIVSLIYLPWSDGTRCHDLSSLNVELKANFFTLLFHFHQEAFYFLFTFCHKGGVICISEVIDISLAILIPACASSSPVFLMMYSAYKLNKQGDNIQPWRTPFPI